MALRVWSKIEELLFYAWYDHLCMNGISIRHRVHRCVVALCPHEQYLY